MRDGKAILPVVGLLLGMASIACLTPTEPSSEEGWISVESAQVFPRQSIVFGGHSNLRDGSCLYTRLYARGLALEWWPMETCVFVENGAWQVSVPLGSGGAPESLPLHGQYSLHVWSAATPSVRSEAFWFDLIPPPTASE